MLAGAENLFTKEAGSDEEAVVAALLWVKENARNAGSFVGEHTHKPYPLDQMRERRFGDGKEQGTRLAALLRRMGFHLAPALVNTGIS